MAGPPFIPKTFEELSEFVLDITQRIDNFDRRLGKGFSHNDLLDTEDHALFIRADGTVPMQANLDMGNNMITAARNDILVADVQRGDVRVDNTTNQLTASGTDSKATSAGTLASTANSKATSAGTQASTADSKAVSAGSQAISNSTVISTNLSVCTSKDLSQSSLISANTSSILSAHP